MDRSQLKAMSREQIRGKIGILFVIALIMSGITAVINGLLPDYTVQNQSAEGYNLTIDFFALPVAILVTSAFTLSNARIYLGITGQDTCNRGYLLRIQGLRICRARHAFTDGLHVSLDAPLHSSRYYQKHLLLYGTVHTCGEQRHVGKRCNQRVEENNERSQNGLLHSFLKLPWLDTSRHTDTRYTLHLAYSLYEHDDG